MIANDRDNANPEDITMVDDGSGITVSIPTILISKEDGMVIKDAIKTTEEANRRGQGPKQFAVLLIEFENVRLATRMINLYRLRRVISLNTTFGTRVAMHVLWSLSSKCLDMRRDWKRMR